MTVDSFFQEIGSNGRNFVLNLIPSFNLESMTSLKRTLAALLLIVPLFFLPTSSKAGDHHKSGDGGWWNHDRPGTSVPIDGGITILLIAGLGFGVKKILDRNKKMATI